MAARVTFKQNIGHIGKEVVVAGVPASQVTIQKQVEVCMGFALGPLGGFHP